MYYKSINLHRSLYSYINLYVYIKFLTHFCYADQCDSLHLQDRAVLVIDTLYLLAVDGSCQQSTTTNHCQAVKPMIMSANRDDSPSRNQCLS